MSSVRVAVGHVLQRGGLLRRFGGRSDFALALPCTHQEGFSERIRDCQPYDNTWLGKCRYPVPRSEVQSSTNPRDHAGSHRDRV